MFFDKPETQQRLSDTGALGEPSTFAERTIAAFKSTQDRNFGVVNGGAMLDAYEARRKAVMDAVGEDIGNPFTQAMNQLPPMGDANGYGMPGPLPELKPRGQMEADFQSALERLAEKHPDKRDIIAPHKPVRSTFASEVREREQKSIDAGRNYGGITGTGRIADFVGGMGAQVTDPVNAATILIGPTGRVGQGAKAIIGMGVKQGIANAGVEAAMAPLVQDFRRQMGQSYGLGEAAYDIGIAAALGFAADAGIRTAARGIQSKLGRRAILDADGKVTGYESAEASIARATRQAESQARAEQLKALQDDGTVQRAIDGDPEAIAKVDPILGLSEDPAVRGASQVQEFVELEPGDFDDIAKSRTFNQALRAAIDADEPPPVIKMERASNRPSLSDDMEIPKGTEGNQHFRTIDIEGKPVHFQNLDPKKITTDAEAMQFKSGGNQFGVTGALGINTTFDPAAAGKVIVFERADGVTIIVDGHQRLSIAKDGDQFQGFVFREADGWSAAEVRAEAALKNIQEGRANLLDTVRAMREHGPQMEGRIAVDTDFMRQAVGMSRLSDAAFVRLEAGTIEPHMAALVGELVPDQTKHDGVVQALMRANPATEAAARKIIGREIREPVTVEGQTALLGAQDVPDDLIAPRSEVLGDVVAVMRQGTPEQMAASLVIERLSDRPGYVSNLLTDAARAIHTGQPKTRVVDAFMRQIEVTAKDGGVEARIAELPRVDPLMLPKGNESVTAKLGDTVMTYSRVVGQDKALYIEEVATKGEGSGKGNARALLQGLAEQADVHGMTIDLLAQPGTRTTDLRRLVRLYESIGFVATSQTEHGVEMIRLPLSNAINQAIRDGSEEPARLFALSDVSTGRSMRADLDKLGYYSKALEAAKSMKQAKGTPEQMMAQLKTAGVKQAELDAVNLAAFLDGKKSITRDDLVKHLTDNRVALSEAAYGEMSIPGKREAFSAARQPRDEAVAWLRQVYPESAEADPAATLRRMAEGGNIGRFPNMRPIPHDMQAEAATRLRSLDDYHAAGLNLGLALSGEGKFQKYSLDPSNPSYRETVLHLPESKVSFDDYLRFRQENGTAYSDPIPENLAAYRRDYDEGLWRTNGGERALSAKEKDTNFRSGHFPEPNIVGHMMTSLNKHEGKPVYTLDQIQSDWGQKLRDGGVRDEAKIAELRSAINGAALKAETMRADISRSVGDDMSNFVSIHSNVLPRMEPLSVNPGDADSIQRAIRAYNSRFNDLPQDVAQQLNGITSRYNEVAQPLASVLRDQDLRSAELRTAEASAPGHPLVNTTDQWTNTTLRRALRQAVEADAAFIAIPHGDTVLSYNPGDDAGMKGFYGSRTSEGIVPKNLRKLIEKLDPQAPRPVKIETLETPSGPRGWKENGERNYDKSQTGFTLFPITEKIRKSVIEEGQPLFAKHDALQPVDQKALQDLTETLERALIEAQKPSPPRLVDDVTGKDGKAHLEDLREEMADDIKGAVDPVTVEARLAALHAYRAGRSVMEPSNLWFWQKPDPSGTALMFHATNRNFDKFDLGQSADFGIHFGTAKQAATRLSDTNRLEGGRTIPAEVTVRNAITMGDQGFWGPVGMATELQKQGYKVTAEEWTKFTELADSIDKADADVQRIGNTVKPLLKKAVNNANVAIKTKLNELGIDGIWYKNTAEGSGWSLIVWNEGQVRNAITQEQMLSIDLSKPLIYTAKANELQAEIRKEVDRTLQMLPPDVRIRVEDELVFNLNGGSDARIAGLWDGYDRLVYVALSGNDPVRAVRHEVIHALKQSGLLTADEFKQLYAFSEPLRLRGAYKIDERYRDLYTKAYGERGGDYVENLLREETIAEMFADYSLNGKRFGDVAGGGLVDRLIDRIVSFMKLLRDNLGFLGFRNVNDIFQAIESGEVASRPSSRNPAGGRSPDVVARQIGEAMGGERLASFAGERAATLDQRPSDMINAALAALPDETATAIRNVLKQANIDEAQIGSMVDSLMPLIRSGDQAAVAERVQAMAKEAAPQMMPPQSEFGRALAELQADKEMLDVIGACRA